MSTALLLLICTIKLAAPVLSSNAASHPNIMFILTDDWGMNDVGWTNDNTKIHTPFLNNLATTESLILSNYYTQRVCTASRAAFLTGRYPSKLGLQAGVLHQNQPFSLTRQVSMLSNELQSAGYSTHIIGKWHLGYQSYEYTPTYRGFDTFYGYYNGASSYFTHKSSIHYDLDTGPPLAAYDLFINDGPAVQNPYNNIYGVWWQRDEAIKLLKYYATADNKNKPPFFFYFALQASHNPREAPIEYVEMYDNNDGYDRNTFAAQTSTVDDALKDIISYMKDSELWESTLVIFASDNGGQKGIGDNAPYRGYKNTSWQGGVKVPGFVTGGVLNDDRKGVTLEYNMHITDWYKTLLSAARVEIKYIRSRKTLLSQQENDNKWMDTDELALDGMDLWQYIQNNDVVEGEREILLDLNEVWCPYSSCGALLIGDYKYIRGENIASLLPDYDGNDWDRLFAENEEQSESFCVENKALFNEYHQTQWEWVNSVSCVGTERGCLFHLKYDPCEYYDLAAVYPDLVERFQTRLDGYQSEAAHVLMGEDNEQDLVVKEVIDPSLVCSDPMYWCPYQTYESVTWEYELFENKNEGKQDTNKKKEDVIIINNGLYLCLWVAMFCGLLFVCRHQQNKKYGHFANQSNNELQPLIVH